MNAKQANRQAVRIVANKLYGRPKKQLPRWLKMLIDSNYRAATKVVNDQAKNEAKLLTSSKAVEMG